MTLRAHTEESAGRVEPLLATPTPRVAWLASHLGVALTGSALIMVAGGLGLGAVYGIVIGDAGQVPRLVGAALVHVPAVWVLVGLGCALYGLVPRFAVAAWGVLAGALVVAMFGQVLDLPGWVRDLSPFQHTPQLPALDFRLVPVVVLLAVTGGFIAVGLVAFRRRDVG
jgi:ABC-2 type transport system permease protein